MKMTVENTQGMQTSGQATRQLIFLSAILTLWLASRPYAGIWHDGLLYAVQALRLINPVNYANDLFFWHGFQDDFTLFTNLYAPAIRLLGLDHAALLLTLIGQGLWLTGAFLLTRRLLAPPLHWVALAAVIAVLGFYSDFQKVTAGESFVTARLYAEGVAMMATAFVVAGRRVWSVLLLGVGMVLHPLNVLPALMFAFFWWTKDHPRLTFAIPLLGVACLLGLAVAGISPADRLLVGIDPEWFAITNERTPHVFASSWTAPYWGKIVIVLCLLAALWRREEGVLGQTARAALLMTLMGIALAWLAGQTLASALLVQLQTWRVMWLAQILAATAFVWLFWRTLSHPDERLAAVGFLAAVFFVETSGAILAIAALTVSLRPGTSAVLGRFWQGLNRGDKLTLTLGLLAAMLLRDNFGGVIAALTLLFVLLPRKHSAPYRKWALLLAGSLGLLGLALFLADTLLLVSVAWHTSTATSAARFLFQLAAVGCLVVALLWPSSLPMRMGASALALVVLSGSALLWDARGTTGRWDHADKSELTRLQEMIGEKDVVYWANHPDKTWFLLGRSNYVSFRQTAGILFDRDTALEAQRRRAMVERGMQEEGKDDGTFQQSFNTAAADTNSVRRACRDPQLHWLVLREELPGAFTVYRERDGGNWHFYRCLDHRDDIGAGHVAPTPGI